ncbi:MAG: molybdate ABC transporter substrate-binding protein [Bryobacteraceae bacterium]
MKWFAALLIALAPASGADLLVAAASDLAPLTRPLEAGFKKASGQRVIFTLASSGSLAQQIDNGAPFDVFLSANDQYVKELVAKGRLVSDSVVVYAHGRIALWSRDGSVHSLEDLAKPQVKHVAIPNPEHAPYGVAARGAMERRGVWKAVEPKVVYGENVRQALQFAESGNVDAVLTSWTLLQGKGVLLPEEWHDPIRQAGGVVKSSTQPEAARGFLRFLTGAAGRKILQDGGLFPP